MTKITIFSSNTWPHCATAKNYLLKNNYKFLEKNVSNNKKYQQELMQLGARGVPTFLIDGELIVGFDKNKIESLIDYKIINCPNCKKKIRIPKNKGKIKVSCKSCDTKFIVKS